MPRAPQFSTTKLDFSRDFRIVKLIDTQGQMVKIRKGGATTRSRRRSATSKRRKSRRRMY